MGDGHNLLWRKLKGQTGRTGKTDSNGKSIYQGNQCASRHREKRLPPFIVSIVSSPPSLAFTRPLSGSKPFTPIEETVLRTATTAVNKAPSRVLKRKEYAPPRQRSKQHFYLGGGGPKIKSSSSMVTHFLLALPIRRATVK